MPSHGCIVFALIVWLSSVLFHVARAPYPSPDWEDEEGSRGCPTSLRGLRSPPRRRHGHGCGNLTCYALDSTPARRAPGGGRRGRLGAAWWRQAAWWQHAAWWLHAVAA
eukprot:13468946-Alexandrium_andersonii.AAC.1